MGHPIVLSVQPGSRCGPLCILLLLKPVCLKAASTTCFLNFKQIKQGIKQADFFFSPSLLCLPLFDITSDSSMSLRIAIIHSFSLLCSVVWIYYHLFIHPTVCGRVCHHFLALIDILVHFCVCVCEHARTIQWSICRGMGWRGRVCMFCFSRYCSGLI